MKFNFRKISAIATSILLTGMTMGVAAAANYPAPFVDAGVANSAVVYGAAGLTDAVAAGNIQFELNKVVTPSSEITITGDNVRFGDSSSNIFGLGENMSDFYSTLDEDELSFVLAEGVYWDDNNDKYEYDQSLSMSNNLQLAFFEDDDNDDLPSIGFDLEDDDYIWNYTLDFTPDDAESDSAWDDFEGTTIKMLGKEYYISEADNSSKKLTLLDTANSATISKAEASTMNVGDKSYEVSIQWMSADYAVFIVNGIETNKLAEGDTYEVTEGVYVSLKNNYYEEKEAEISKAEISIGSGSIELEHGKEVEINDVDVDNLNVYIDSDATSIDSITLEWNLEEDTSLVKGEELVFPGFENIKISMKDFIAKDGEMTTLKESSDTIKLSTTVSDGDVDFSVLYANSTWDGFEGFGSKSSDVLETSDEDTDYLNFTNVKDKPMFVVTWINGDDYESYVLQITDIDDSDVTKNVTTIESIASGSNEGVTINFEEMETIGNKIRITLDAANEDNETADITVTSALGAGYIYLDRIVTAEGLKIQLPQDTNSSKAGYLNLTNATDVVSWDMNFTEEDEDNGIDLGESFTATLSFESDEEKAEVNDVSVTDFETGTGNDEYEGYVESALSTRTLLDKSGNLNELDIEYFGDETIAEVYISESGAVTTTPSELGVQVYTDAESASFADKNIIVVGGSCVNTIAATLVGGSLCGDDWTTATSAGTGKFLVKSYAYGEKVALLVAGYEAADTTAAATYVTTQEFDSSTIDHVGPVVTVTE